jgi:hypothetical protein
MPQVYKLLTPHFVYTLRMNANARSALVNQTGLLEVSACLIIFTVKAPHQWKVDCEMIRDHHNQHLVTPNRSSV